MVSEEEIKSVFVGKHTLVGDKRFKIVDAGIIKGRVYFKVNCEGLPPNIIMDIDARANEEEYLGLYDLMADQARRRPTSQPEEARAPVEGELKKIEPELKFAYDPRYARKGIGVVGKAFYVNPKKFGITKDNGDKVHGKVLALEEKIETLKLRRFTSKIRLKPGDADVPNLCVSRCVAHKMNISQLIMWEKKILPGLHKIWQRQDSPPKRVKQQIDILKKISGSYSKLKIYDEKLGKKGFKKPEYAKFLYEGLKLLPDKSLREVFKLKGRITKATRDIEIPRKIHHYQKQDEVWEYYWDCLVAAIYLINKLIPKINQAISQQGRQRTNQ